MGPIKNWISFLWYFFFWNWNGAIFSFVSRLIPCIALEYWKYWRLRTKWPVFCRLTFWNQRAWLKIWTFLFKVHGGLFPRVQLATSHYLNQWWLLSLMPNVTERLFHGLVQDCSAVSPLLMPWRYCSLALSHCIVLHLLAQVLNLKHPHIPLIGGWYLSQITLYWEFPSFLTHWPLGDLNVILKMWFSILFYWQVSSDFLMIMPSDECHRTLLIISQHWCR